MNRFSLARVAVSLAFLVPAAVTAQQQSESYRFLQAVRDSKGDDVTKMLARPGTTILNTHDYSSGEGALHIVVRRGDPTYLNFLLSQPGVDPNIRDNQGNTPLMLAVTLGQDGLADTLLDNAWHKADPNVGNNSGETPLIIAVHRRDISLARALLDAGADPDETDHLAGLSARNYAKQDSRSPILQSLLANAPKKTRAAVVGPKF